MAYPKHYKNKYRRGTKRADWWDYNNNGTYHIEINLSPRIYWLGKISNQEVQLSKAGEIVQKEWLNIPAKSPFAEIDTFVIMPDHFHGIIHINPPYLPDLSRSLPREKPGSLPRDKSRGYGDDKSHGGGDDKAIGGATGDKNPMLHDNLGNCIRAFKARCTIQIHKIIPDFKWQNDFWDNIIPSQRELETVRKYIRDNPKNWSPYSAIYRGAAPR